MRINAIDLKVTFRSACEYGVRTPDNEPDSQDAIKQLVSDFSVFLASMAKRSKCSLLICANCRGEYPGLYSFPRCPFCDGDRIVTHVDDEENLLDLDDDTTALAPMDAKGLEAQQTGIVEAKNKLYSLARDMMKNAYEMGEIFARVQTLELWREDEATPNCGGFKEWCEENGYSYTTAERLIRVTKQFPKELVDGVRLKISGFIELGKAVKDLPKADREKAVNKVIDQVNKSPKPPSTKAVREMAAAAREEVLGDELVEDDDLTDVTPERASVVDVAPELPTVTEAIRDRPPEESVQQGHKFKAEFVSRLDKAAFNVGDLLRFSIIGKNVTVEVKLTKNGADCYWYDTRKGNE